MPERVWGNCMGVFGGVNDAHQWRNGVVIRMARRLRRRHTWPHGWPGRPKSGIRGPKKRRQDWPETGLRVPKKRHQGTKKRPQGAKKAASGLPRNRPGFVVFQL